MKTGYIISVFRSVPINQGMSITKGYLNHMGDLFAIPYLHKNRKAAEDIVKKHGLIPDKEYTWIYSIEKAWIKEPKGGNA